ncbi:MAG: head maturation protease, ClpP-related [Pseudomonadota bacterium]
MIRLEGYIGEEPATAAAVSAELSALNGGAAELVINSGGGIATEGAAIHAEVSAYSGRTMIYIRGIAASAASLAAMAADEIVIDPASLMMIHDPAAMTMGTAEDHRSSADVLDTMSQAYAAIYARRTGNPVVRVREWMAAETWLTAEEAVALGFADRVGERQAEPIAAFNYRAYAQAPAALAALAQAEGWAAPTPDHATETPA